MNQEQRLNELFGLAKEVTTVHSFQHASERFKASLDAGIGIPKKQTSILSIKNVSIMLAIASTAVLSWFLLTTKDESNTNPSNYPAPEQTSRVSVVDQPKEASDSIESVTDESASLTTITEFVTNASQNLVDVTSLPLIEEGFKPPFPLEQVKVYDDEYQFPKLTDEEIAANNKRKKAMLKALEKFDKKHYVFVPTGTFEYEGKVVSVQAFYMQKNEVTNAEYRTFLFDLLIQERKEEFLKAKPDQSAWVTFFNLKPYEEYYFSHPAYDEYPMVNVSKEGAEMYCKWLSQELMKSLDEKKKKNYNDVRLPLRCEWVKAASNEGAQLPYPWDGQFMRNAQGLYQANYTRPVSDSLGVAGDFDNADLTAPVSSYFPNALGLYDLAGNVAEIVYEAMDKKEVGTCGGSWRNSEEEIKILAPDPYKGKVVASPMIGFRVLMTYIKPN